MHLINPKIPAGAMKLSESRITRIKGLHRFEYQYHMSLEY